MKVGVLSDTHIPKRAGGLPKEVIQAFRNVDHIIHAGDIACPEVLEELAHLAPVTAVGGNVDPESLQKALGSKKIINLNGFRIGVAHGHGTAGRTLDRVLKCFEQDQVDCMIFGHSHIPFCEYRNNILLFNPGSPTDKRRNQLFSFGILELSHEIQAKHVFFESREVKKLNE